MLHLVLQGLCGNALWFKEVSSGLNVLEVRSDTINPAHFQMQRVGVPNLVFCRSHTRGTCGQAEALVHTHFCPISRRNLMPDLGNLFMATQGIDTRQMTPPLPLYSFLIHIA
jgi:hypothetical protein